jgi:hypothetical protein
MITKLASLAARARRESSQETAPGAPSDRAAAGDRTNERLELAIDELEERLAPGGTVKPPKPTAGWGC